MSNKRRCFNVYNQRVFQTDSPLMIRASSLEDCLGLDHDFVSRGAGGWGEFVGGVSSWGEGGRVCRCNGEARRANSWRARNDE